LRSYVVTVGCGEGLKCMSDVQIDVDVTLGLLVRPLAARVKWQLSSKGFVVSTRKLPQSDHFREEIPVYMDGRS
jgi:hypothetical protein